MQNKNLTSIAEAALPPSISAATAARTVLCWQTTWPERTRKSAAC